MRRHREKKRETERNERVKERDRERESFSMVFKISKLLNEMNMFDDALIRSIYTKYSRSNRFNFNKVIFFNRKRLLFSVSRPSSIVIRSFRTCYREVNLRSVITLFYGFIRHTF